MLFRSKDSFVFLKDGGNEFLFVQSNLDLKYISSESWCKINKIDTDSKITKKFEISVDPNTETDLRTAVITISNDYLKKEIEITQQAATRFIIKNNSFEMDGNGGIITIELETSGDYEIVINNEEWISRVDLKTISKTEQFIIDKNQFTDSRSGTITF